MLTVSGIGPRTALSIVSRGYQAVHDAVIKADVEFFTSIPRLGTKNAQKVIIELKTKLGSVKDLVLDDSKSEEIDELLLVLTGMGFSKNEAIRAVKVLPPEIKTIEEKIRIALKFIGKK